MDMIEKGTDTKYFPALEKDLVRMPKLNGWLTSHNKIGLDSWRYLNDVYPNKTWCLLVEYELQAWAKNRKFSFVARDKLQTCANSMDVTDKSDQEIPLIDLAVVFEYFSDFFHS